jgi:hypothetical protein
MAKMTPLAKLEKASKDLTKVREELSDVQEVIKLANNDRVKAKMENAAIRYREDVEYLSLKIRGIIAREAPIEKLIASAKTLLS